MRRENIPPSHGVSSGPKMVAFQTKRLSSECGLALHPCFIVCCVDYFVDFDGDGRCFVSATDDRVRKRILAKTVKTWTKTHLRRTLSY